MPTEIKICGLSDPESVDAALEAGADYLGFNFFAKSPRHVAPELAGALAERARGKAAIVAVTVDLPDHMLAAIIDTLRPDFVQFHGAETPERVAAIRSRFGTAAIKAIGVAGPDDLAALARYDSDLFLLDAKPPRDATRPGGLGVTFDWSLLARFKCGTPWFLSGGLTPGNVADALHAVRPGAVDVSSGVESAPGKKNPALIEAFVAAVRAADAPPKRRSGQAG